MPSCIEAAATMQAAARIGCIHAVVFAGFSHGALRERIKDCSAKLIVTMDSSFRNGKEINLKNTVANALKDNSCPTVKSVITLKRTGNYAPEVSGNIDEYDFETEVNSSSSVCPPVPMDSEAPLYIMYTSGSTGKPKGLVHTTGGFVVNMKMAIRHAWNITENDIVGCPADIGWQVGHSINVYGSLLNGNTSFLFESTPVYPDPSRYYKSIDKWKFTHLMSAPTAYRMLMKSDHLLRTYEISPFTQNP